MTARYINLHFTFTLLTWHKSPPQSNQLLPVTDHTLHKSSAKFANNFFLVILLTDKHINPKT